MNSRISSSGRLAVAVMLTVLSASAALAHVKNLSVLGSLGGNGIGVVQEGGTLQASGGGTGNASHIGRFTYVLNATVNVNGSSTGVFLLVFNNGDVIHGCSPGSEGRLTLRTWVTLLKT